MESKHGIVILDFGAQYSQLIARRVREHHVHSILVPYNISLAELKRLEPAGIILSGGPSSVFDEGAPHSDPALLQMGIPVLGICYGLQLIAQQMGGKVEPARQREYGRAQLEILDGSRLLRTLPSPLPVWNSHGDSIVELPPGFHQSAKTETTVGAIENAAKNIYAVQFHPEVHHTAHGDQILANFVFDICHASPDWTSQSFIEHTVESVREKVGAAIQPHVAIGRNVVVGVGAAVVSDLPDNVVAVGVPAKVIKERPPISPD